ncbi:predicted protein [Chaetoceros tenuissimus]|uniref:Uncharacterized protein n=1 Tax=Chaetoceros tenuissimus TaxID=426638 RepID=A0AAD3D8W6_9STRA|nr:predicted protein [Chaetoceros tenuissimus]
MTSIHTKVPLDNEFFLEDPSPPAIAPCTPSIRIMDLPSSPPLMKRRSTHETPKTLDPNTIKQDGSKSHPLKPKKVMTVHSEFDFLFSLTTNDEIDAGRKTNVSKRKIVPMTLPTIASPKRTRRVIKIVTP